jgi:hypothetical protein
MTGVGGQSHLASCTSPEALIAHQRHPALAGRQTEA